MKPYSVAVIAEWFLTQEPMTHKKLQKLCYYAQAWGLVLLGHRIIDTTFQAWVHGPVSPDLFDIYRKYVWQPIPQLENLPELSSEVIEVLEAVWERYGHLDGEELEYVAIAEKPWLEKREGLEPITPCYNIISENTMQEFYSDMLVGIQGCC